MNKKILCLILLLLVLILSVSLIAATKDQDPRLAKKTLSSSRSSNIKDLGTRRTYNGPIYRKSGRQSQVLFVEDPGMSGFGPLTKPDPQWTSWLDQTLGAGNYDWYGPIVDSSDGPPVDTMALYDLVIWNCYDWWWSPCFAPTTGAVANMSTYMDGGGKVWFIGQDANYAYGASFLTTFLTPYFEVQNITDDVLYNPYIVSLTGEGVLSGYAWTDSSDYQANGFYSDDLTPTANGQQITTDGTYHFNVIKNDYTSSFWTIDGGRVADPESTWVDFVDSMFVLFGVSPGVAEKPGKTMPLVFGLVKNAPNPVKSGYTAISYTTTKRGPVSLKVYDSAGRLVRTLVDRPNDYAGAQTVYWDMRDNNHQQVAAGVYFYRLTAENKTATNKMVVVK